MIFQHIETDINSILSTLTVDKVAPMVTDISHIMSAYFTLWVMYHGYMTLAGKSEEPVKEILWKSAVITIIILFATHGSSWFQLVIDSINNLHDWAAGHDGSLYKAMDDIYEKELHLGDVLYKKTDGAMKINIEGFAAQSIVSISFWIFSLFTIGIIVGTTITLKILIMIAPIMIASKLFGWTSKLFDNWLGLILNNTLTVLLIGLFFTSIKDKYTDTINYALLKSNGKIDVLSVASDIFIFSVIMIIIVMMAVGIASAITYVSIENLPSAKAREAANNASQAKHAATNASKKSIGAVSTASRGVGNISAKAIRKLRK